MKWLERISSLFLMAFSVLIFWSSVRLGIGSPGDPGPGFMPILASVVLFGVSIVIFVIGIQGASEKESSLTDLRGLTKPVCLVMILLGYAYLLGILGFLGAAFLAMFAMFSLAERRKWRLNLVISGITVIVGYIVFAKWLQVQLPAGILGI